MDGVDVIWTAPSPRAGRYVVGWYRDATVFRYLQKYERGLYHVQASKTDYVLLPPNKRRLIIKSAKVQPCGFGRNVWYADIRGPVALASSNWVGGPDMGASSQSGEPASPSSSARAMATLIRSAAASVSLSLTWA